MNGFEWIIIVFLFLFVVSGFAYIFTKIFEIKGKSLRTCYFLKQFETFCLPCKFEAFTIIPWPVCYVFLFTLASWILYANSGYGIIGGLHLSINDFITGSTEFFSSLNATEPLTSKSLNGFNGYKSLYEMWSATHQLFSYLVLATGGGTYIYNKLYIIGGDLGDIKKILSGNSPDDDNNGGSGKNGSNKNGREKEWETDRKVRSYRDLNELNKTIENYESKINKLEKQIIVKDSKIANAIQMYEDEISNIEKSLKEKISKIKKIKNKFGDSEHLKAFEKRLDNTYDRIKERRSFSLDFLSRLFGSNDNEKELGELYLLESDIDDLEFRYNDLLIALTNLRD